MQSIGTAVSRDAGSLGAHHGVTCNDIPHLAVFTTCTLHHVRHGTHTQRTQPRPKPTLCTSSGSAKPALSVLSALSCLPAENCPTHSSPKLRSLPQKHHPSPPSSPCPDVSHRPPQPHLPFLHTTLTIGMAYTPHITDTPLTTLCTRPLRSGDAPPTPANLRTRPLNIHGFRWRPSHSV